MQSSLYFFIDTLKLKFLQCKEKGIDLPIAFRDWELHEYSLLQQTMKYTWTIKAKSQLEKRRYVIIGFQIRPLQH